MSKVLLFGIDGASPELLFGKWKTELPNISKVMDAGCYAKLTSTIPPTTIIAWNAMISGKDPSELGVFKYTYTNEAGETKLVNSTHLQSELIWDIIGKQNKKTVALYVPLSFPVKKINGVMVGGFLTPGVDSNCAYPESIKEKIKALGNTEIFFDVVEGLAGHKSLDIAELLKRTYEMTDMQVTLLKDLIKNEEWDFFMSVMIGTDRLQHMIWRHFDETHRRFVPDSPHKNALLDYYKYLDKKLGEVLELIDEDTTVIIASDHGMVKQEGKININNWLIKEGYLVLKEDVDINKRQWFKRDFVDMTKSVAFGGGAYNGRIFINKEKVGDNYNQLLNELTTKVKAIPDDKGNPIDTKVYKKEDIYVDKENEECPDLTVYFDDLRWASNPDLGEEGMYSWKNAVGSDSAGHSRQGCFIIKGPSITKRGQLNDFEIRQVAPTILKILGVAIPDDIKVKGMEV